MTVYYSVDEPTLVKYLNNDLKLSEIYLESNDTVVHHNFQMEPVYFIKVELTDLISCGERLFIENSEGIRSDRLAGLFKCW